MVRRCLHRLYRMDWMERMDIIDWLIRPFRVPGHAAFVWHRAAGVNAREML